VAAGTWEQLTDGLDDDDRKKLTAFRDYCRKLGSDVDERVHTSEIAFAVKRVFASAYIKSHYLEVGIDLPRVVTTPKPRATVASTKTRTLHRYSLRELPAFDVAIKKLIREAYDEAASAA
jgi:fumarylacetoacetate (FAA) hydrolase family protein